jgi:hypothetical protein
MADSNSVEVDAIAEAYRDRIGLLFSVLVTNLGDKPATHSAEKECVDKFKTGLNDLRKAKQLALAVLAAAPSV